MIKELSDLGKKLREEQSTKKLVHDAIKDEPVSIDLIIRNDGSFESFLVIPKKMTSAEAITAKKGKVRLLLDKAEEVLCFKSQENIDELKEKPDSKKKIKQFNDGVESKHKLFITKLEGYKELAILQPVFKFYFDNKSQGIQKALTAFPIQVDKKQRRGNIAFRLVNQDERLHENSLVLQAIIERFEEDQSRLIDGSGKICSLCGLSEFPIIDKPHGTINRVPGGLSAGNVLVSYNEHAFESYGLIGNENSSICTNCARTYVEGLKWLLNNGRELPIIDKKGKEKVHFRFTNRKKIGPDTAMVYWTRENQKLDEIELLESPDAEQVGLLIDSIASGKESSVKAIKNDQFYACTLSGAAARIAIRDWIELSLADYRKNIGLWFMDISIESYGKLYYAPIYWLAQAGHNEKVKTDIMSSRIAAYLWNAGLKGGKPPIWILSAVLKRLRYMPSSEEGNTNKKDPMTRERAALIRLILNRNKKGGVRMKEQLDTENLSPAYICGQIFAVLVDIQRAALGRDINAGIRERFFSFASTTPAPAFGRLMKLSQNHLTKLKGEKPGISFVLDRELQELHAKIPGNEYPAVLTLEEQGQFALGYYHKKEETWQRIQASKELKEALENEEEKK